AAVKCGTEGQFGPPRTQFGAPSTMSRRAAASDFSTPAFDLPTHWGIKSTSSASESVLRRAAESFGRLDGGRRLWPRDRIHERCAAFLLLRFVHVSRM